MFLFTPSHVEYFLGALIVMNSKLIYVHPKHLNEHLSIVISLIC